MARAHRKKPPLTLEQVQKNTEILGEIAEATDWIRFNQESILTHSKIRTDKVLEARSKGISYRAIAQAMNTSEQTVYKIVKPYLNKDKNDL